MKQLFDIKVTPTFKRGYKSLLKRERNLSNQLIELVEILRHDPYNTSMKYDIKKLTNVSKGEGQWRIRKGNYRLRYDINERDVIVHTFSHRKDAYN